jgi:hypothetical protein
MRMLSSAVLLLASALASCASTPKQTVELSATVGRDIAAVHLAHVALAKRYFDRMESDVNSFVDGVYRPYSIEHNMGDFHLVEKITKPPAGLDALDIMGLFVDTITKDIEGYRLELLRPIRAQRETVLASLEQAYRQIQDGQSIITGHLASIVAVQDAQDQALAKAGLAGLRERLVDATAKSSDEIADLTRKATFVRGKEEDIAKAAEALKTATKSLGK